MFKLDPQERLIRAVVKRFGMCFLTLGLCLSATGCARMARAFLEQSLGHYCNRVMLRRSSAQPTTKRSGTIRHSSQGIVR